MIAAKRFDVSRGFKFISYAVWWIRQTITQYLTESGRTVYLPSNRVSLVGKVKNITSKLEQELNREPVMEEVADKLMELSGDDFEASELNWLMAVNTRPTSLDTKIGEDNDGSLSDLLITEPLGDVNATFRQNDLEITFKRVIEKRLTPREKQVIVSYYGLFGSSQKTLEEIGNSLELTRERVRQIKERAVGKLKSPNAKRAIQEYL